MDDDALRPLPRQLLDSHFESLLVLDKKRARRGKEKFTVYGHKHQFALCAPRKRRRKELAPDMTRRSSSLIFQLGSWHVVVPTENVPSTCTRHTESCVYSQTFCFLFRFAFLHDASRLSDTRVEFLFVIPTINGRQFHQIEIFIQNI